MDSRHYNLIANCINHGQAKVPSAMRSVRDPKTVPPCNLFGFRSYNVHSWLRMASNRNEANCEIMSSIESLIGLACQVNDFVAQAMRPAIIDQGLTSASFDLLSAVWAADGRETQAEIGKRLGLSRATISEAITSLVTAGYVIRRPSEIDSRAVNLELTSSGHRKVKSVLGEMKRIEAELEGKIGAKETDSASKTLRKVLNALKVEIS